MRGLTDGLEAARRARGELGDLNGYEHTFVLKTVVKPAGFLSTHFIGLPEPRLVETGAGFGRSAHSRPFSCN